VARCERVAQRRREHCAQQHDARAHRGSARSPVQRGRGVVGGILMADSARRAGAARAGGEL
jgi:hypothetical protein